MSYPNVKCRKHADSEPKPGYIICPHPNRTVRQLPEEFSAGVIACAACAETLTEEYKATFNPDLFSIACADCAARYMAN